MKRKETKLEKNLIEKGYSLEYKTYEGKHKDKVSGYVYSKSNGIVNYYVELDKTREHINHYWFTTIHHYIYDQGKLEGLQEVLAFMEEQLCEIYDFKNRVALDLYDFTDFDIDFDNRVDIIEESDFDD